MRDNRSHLHLPVAASTFAGLLGAGLVDAIAVLTHGQPGQFGQILALTVGLYGTAGLMAAILAGWASAKVVTAIPGGLAALRDDLTLDTRVCGFVLGGTVSGAALALGTGISHAVFVSNMSSHTLATIASAGMAFVLLLPSSVLFLATWEPAARLAQRFLPRPTKLGRTGLVMLVLAGSALLAFVAALSRADWRVLDLGPFASLGIAVVLGLGHGWFWYRSTVGQRWSARLPRRIVGPALAVLAILALAVGSRIHESSPSYAAIQDGGLGIKFALKVARKLTDHDGDGYSALFGGGDCDDKRADVFPGAEDIPGDGVDQNCEGGDAPVIATALAEMAEGDVLGKAVQAKAGAFSGNVLIIALDATRADRLGVAGYGRPAGRSLTPNLDALAQRGAYFRRVWAQAPNTPRSFPSFVTSQYPSEIAWQKRSLNYSPLLPSNRTFFEPIAAAGLRPIGIFSHFYFTPDRGISKAFAEWSDDGAKSIADSNKDIAAPRIVPRVIERLKKAAAKGERFVLWTHLFEPHSSYMSHGEFPTTLSGVQGLEEKYDYEIAFADQWIGKIFKTLEETKLAQNTAVVVFGDHGEAWGEHKVYFHGQNLTEEQIRVPLIVAVPGQKPVVSDEEAGLIDVGPTLVDLVGVKPPANLHGRSLLPIIQGGSLSPRPIFSELLPSTATPDHEVVIVDRGKKLVHKVSAHRFELFDLATDPRQLKNVAEDPSYQKAFAELKTKLLAFEEHRPSAK
jgi:arylsulfatase A-like enzyme